MDAQLVASRVVLSSTELYVYIYIYIWSERALRLRRCVTNRKVRGSRPDKVNYVYELT
jgi:hypothetical protein